MPEFIRSLVVILFLASMAFYFLRIPANEIIGARIFNLRRNLWLGITLIAFLAQNFWIFISLTWLLLFIAAPRDKNGIIVTRRCTIEAVIGRCNQLHLVMQP